MFLTHRIPNATTGLRANASDSALGAFLHQHIKKNWAPVAFFHYKLKPTEIRYTTFERELLATYAAIRHIRHFLEGQIFHIFTDNKPLAYVFRNNHSSYTGRETRQLVNLTMDLRHVKRNVNQAVDVLPRISGLSSTQAVTLEQLALEQEAYP